MRKFIYAVLIAASVTVLIQACSKSDSGTTPTNGGGNGSTTFDRKAMLTNISTTIILPAYNSWQTVTANLDAAIIAFNTAPDAAKLTAVQTAFSAAYLQWQSVSEFEFGPAAEVTLRTSTNTYPADLTQINANVSSGTYNPQLLTNLAAKGLPALDYLLFGTGADNAAILGQYTTDANAAKRKTYIAALSAEMKTNAATVAAKWNGDYKTTFVNAAGTDVGSSTGQMVNQLVFDYEILKNFEIGIPAGTQSMGTTFPTKVQAVYSKTSVVLAKAHLQAMLDLYTGKTGSGLDDYLDQVNAKYSDGQPLNTVIKAQFAAAATKLNTLTDPLSAQITASPATVTTAYTELQKLTVLLKTDMTSSLGILITYGDNDGD